METLRNLSLAQVKALAKRVAKPYRSQAGTIGLTGNLGSGKTTFAKALLQHFGIRRANSPTFVIHHQYARSGRQINHLDFYRLSQDKQLTPLGLDEMMSGQNVTIIEWVDKFPRIRNQCDLVIDFKIRPADKRDVTLHTN